MRISDHFLFAAPFVAAAFCVSAKADPQARPSVPIPTTPGEHLRIPCATSPALTVDIRLPKNYPGPEGKRWPSLFLSSPSGFPGFLKHEAWADTQGVVLIGINDSRNGDWKPITEAQAAAWETASLLKLHPTLHFATGFSGGAWASVRFADRHGKAFAGVLLQCHSGNFQHPPASCALAYIGGIRDSVHSDAFVRDAATKARAAGVRYVQEAHLDMGHFWAPADVVQRMLTNMLVYARMANSGLNAAEKKEGEALPATLIANAEAENDPEIACGVLDPLVDIEAFRALPFRAKALEIWARNYIKKLDTIAADKALVLYADPKTHARIAEAGGSAAAARSAFIKKIKADPSVKGDFVAVEELVKLRVGCDRDRGRARFNKAGWRKRFEALAKKNEGSVIAELATTDAIALK